MCQATSTSPRTRVTRLTVSELSWNFRNGARSKNNLTGIILEIKREGGLILSLSMLSCVRLTNKWKIQYLLLRILCYGTCNCVFKISKQCYI